MFCSYHASPDLEARMDNRLNELRRKIRTLRLEMLDLEATTRDQIRHDQDCTASASQTMAMRKELAGLVRQWGILGGGDRLPTITERLRENYRPVVRPKPVPEKVQKRRLVARGR